MAEIIRKKDIPEVIVPQNWDYDRSVKKTKNLFRAAREDGAGALIELYVAWVKLTEDSKKKKGRKWPDKTFEGYCDEIDINQATAYRWLHKYFDIPLRAILAFARIPVFELRPKIYRQKATKFLKNLPDKHADLLLTDPPYMTNVDDIRKFSKGWLPLALTKIKDTGRAYVFVGAYPEELQAYLAISKPNQILVWGYNNTMTGNMPKYKYFENWQAILYFVGEKAKPLDCPIDLDHLACINIPHPARTVKRVYEYQKPDILAEHYICHSTKKGDLIIDPYAGSGTFLVAAARHARWAIGSEINQEVIKIAKKRGCVDG